MRTIYTLVLLLALIDGISAQTCGGEIVRFRETFGTGTARAPLATGRTNYNYNGTGSLNDGDYTLYRSTQAKPEWHNATDHTGDLNGRMMVTNASYAPGEFYRDTVYGVSSVSTYNIYFYAMNVNTVGTCAPNPILPGLQVIVESYNFDGTFTEIYTLSSPLLPQTNSPTWVLISGQFYLPTACTAVRYRIINNSTGGCGNDLAIDDITFSQCNPTLLPIDNLAGRPIAARPPASTKNTELVAYSNPFVNQLKLDIYSEKPQRTMVNIFDVNGKIVRSQPWILKSGKNTAALNALDNLAAGMYFINVTDDNRQVIAKTKALKK